MRHELVECDCCGRVWRMEHWRERRTVGRTMLVIPRLWRVLHGSFFDVCCSECEEIFRAFSVWLYDADVHDMGEFSTPVRGNAQRVRKEWA